MVLAEKMCFCGFGGKTRFWVLGGKRGFAGKRSFVGKRGFAGKHSFVGKRVLRENELYNIGVKTHFVVLARKHVLAENEFLQFWRKTSFCSFGGKTRFVVLAGKRGFGGKTHFCGFGGKHGFTGKLIFTVSARNCVFAVLVENAFLRFW